MHSRLFGALLVGIVVLVNPLALAAQATSGTGAVYCPQLTRDLQLGDRDSMTQAQVTELQHFLSSYYDITAADIVTGYFGKVTMGAVIRFQQDRAIVPAVGYVGPKTRAEILRACGGTSSSNRGNSGDSSQSYDASTFGGKTDCSQIVNDYYCYPGQHMRTDLIGQCIHTFCVPNSTDATVVASGTLAVTPASGQLPLTVSIVYPLEISKKVNSCIYGYGFNGASSNGLTVSWGDGSVSPMVSDANRGQSCTTEITTHTYTAPGTYTIVAESWHPNTSSNQPVTDWQGSVIVAAGAGSTTCTPEKPQSRNIACSPGLTGLITQVRTSSCGSDSTQPVWSEWVTTLNTCTKSASSGL